jgi:hypothetical protein
MVKITVDVQTAVNLMAATILPARPFDGQDGPRIRIANLLSRNPPMIDAKTGTPLRIRTDEIAGSSHHVPADQLDQVRERLNRHSIRYWVDTQMVSINNGPYIAFVYFDRREDPARIQAILYEVG